jgi:hypothetical protein
MCFDRTIDNNDLFRLFYGFGSDIINFDYLLLMCNSKYLHKNI